MPSVDTHGDICVSVVGKEVCTSFEGDTASFLVSYPHAVLIMPDVASAGQTSLRS